MWKENKRKNELEKELERKSFNAFIRALCLNPGSISYILSKRKPRNKAQKTAKYQDMKNRKE